MKLIVALFVFTAVLLAQPKLSLSSAGAVRPGAPITLNITLSGSNTLDSSAVVGLDFSLTGVVPAIKSSVPDKNMDCVNGTTSFRCILIGDNNPPNATVIANGVIATITFTPTITTQIAIGSTLHGVDAAGDAIVVAADLPVIVSVLSPCDINGDGVIDVNDYLAFQALYRTEVSGGSCGIGDLNGDGSCGAIDEQRILNAIRGQACRTGK